MRLLIAATTLIAASLASAQTPAPAAPAPAAPAGAPAAPAGANEARAKLIAADTNKDGKWDKAEWLAAGRRESGFQMLDADTDGFVSQAELKDGMAKMQARRATAQ
jgi:hypothetical protein